MERQSPALFTQYSNDFYLGFLKNIGDKTTELWIEVTTQSIEPVPFSIQYNSMTVNGTVSRNTSAEISIPPHAVISSFTTREYSKTAHITTHNENQFISVIGYNWMIGSVGEYMAYPCYSFFSNDASLEKYKYYLVSTDANNYTPPLWSQGLIVGCQDNTTITIVPSKTIRIPYNLGDLSSMLLTLHPGEVHSMVINAGQSLYIGKPTIDITGTLISSSKPLSVVSGHECANIPAEKKWCEHLTKQIPPTVTWGKQFLLVPFLGRKHGQYYKIITSEHSTTINQTCHGIKSIFFKDHKGESATIYTNSSTFCHIIADKPILVVQFATGTFGDSQDRGDPIMIIVQPMEQYSNEALFNVQPFKRFDKNYISITTTDPTSILYDKEELHIKWTTIYDASGNIAGYGTHFLVSSGLHSVVHTVGKGAVMVYGFNYHPERGYGFSAGVQVAPINYG